MSHLFPRLSPDSLHKVSGDTHIFNDGVDTGHPGTHPSFSGSGSSLLIYYTRQPDGAAMLADPIRFIPLEVLSAATSGNPPLAVSQRTMQLARQRFDPPRTLFYQLPQLLGYVRPQFSADGIWLTVLHHETQSLWIAPAGRPTDLRQLDAAHVLHHRWSNQGTTLT